MTRNDSRLTRLSLPFRDMLIRDYNGFRERSGSQDGLSLVEYTRLLATGRYNSSRRKPRFK